MYHYRAKTKYRDTKVANYRQDNNDFNTLSTCTFLDCDEYGTECDGQIDTTRHKCALRIQYKHESKEDITGFISKPVVLCCSNVVQVPLSLNPFQLNLDFGTTHQVQMCYTSKQV